MSEKVETDKYSRNVNDWTHSISFHATEYEAGLPYTSNFERRASHASSVESVTEQRFKFDYLLKWQNKVWPSPLRPELIDEWRVLERSAKFDIEAAELNKLSSKEKFQLEQARLEISRREHAREVSLQNDVYVQKMQEEVLKILKQEHLDRVSILVDIEEPEAWYVKWRCEDEYKERLERIGAMR